MLGPVPLPEYGNTIDESTDALPEKFNLFSNGFRSPPMSGPSHPGKPRTIVTLAGALGGFAVALYNYLTPLTGVTGTFGAALVVLACLLIAIACVFVQLSHAPGWRGFLRFMIALGAVLTGLAAYFLHECWLIAAMAIALVGLIYDISATRNNSTGALA